VVKVNHERGSSAPSEQALADRDRRAGLRPTTTTALLMGDPVAGAGRSALDEKRLKDSKPKDDEREWDLLRDEVWPWGPTTRLKNR
jgi:hypothetical protein